MSFDVHNKKRVALWPPCYAGVGFRFVIHDSRQGRRDNNAKSNSHRRKTNDVVRTQRP